VGNRYPGDPGTLPDPDVMDQWGIEWSYFSPWQGTQIADIAPAQLQATLGHEDVITLDELPIMPWSVAAPSSGDFDGDGDVDGGDLLVWQQQLGQSGATAADGNGDHAVDAADLALWRQKFGTPGAGGAGGIVPEPAAVVLASLGSVLFCGNWRRLARMTRLRAFATAFPPLQPDLSA
jgi:hypothetical protein